ncbi:N-acetyl-D-glucosamine kinase [Rubripirellula obstinata]|uniref:N-acetyl-D-glucosamine kinase n=1 Tax=Rubripirellula obstinata TaxID=406547 RepID=A0A5B1CGE2_9BACT|nr:ROK family protein [Rubripirellula obstinata]KAA1260258.1 N-acetyl-D-glucosamine kinase [Rubripirellula obstinata]
MRDKRIVLTLDAGGTNFVFSAVDSSGEVISPVRLPAETKDLNKSLQTITSGFEQAIEKSPRPPVAISFAFPGPADYPSGIIDNVGNLPAFAGGVALGPYLQWQFGLPTFINNDGDLFAYGEAIAGLLPDVNKQLELAGSKKRYRTLFAITLGTGLGGGLVHNGELFIGDNSNASEVWLLRNRLRPECFAEEGACIRAVRGSYAKHANISFDDSPTPQQIAAMAKDTGEATNQHAAIQAYLELGQVVGGALANAITLLDGLVVIGGGISGAYELFMQPLLDEMQGKIETYDGKPISRIMQRVFNLQCNQQRAVFMEGATRTLTIPGSKKEITYDPMKRIGIGITRLGTSRAISIGAHAFAIHQIDKAVA